MYNDLIMYFVISLLGFIAGAITTSYLILKRYVVLNKEGLENTWNLGASIGDTESFSDSKERFEEYYEDLRKYS